MRPKKTLMMSLQEMALLTVGLAPVWSCSLIVCQPLTSLGAVVAASRPTGCLKAQGQLQLHLLLVGVTVKIVVSPPS